MNVNEICADIRAARPTPEDAMRLLDVMRLLNVISGNLCDQRRALLKKGVRDSFQTCVMLREAARLLDDCADEISNIEGVEV